MTHPIPPGTRDVLPDEMRELRAITERLRAVVRAAPATARCCTPALEYEDVLRRGDERAAGARLPHCSTSTATCWRCAPT